MKLPKQGFETSLHRHKLAMEMQMEQGVIKDFNFLKNRQHP